MLGGAVTELSPRRIASLLNELKETGVRDSTHFEMFLPLSRGLPECIELQEVPLVWQDLFKDTDESACFAFVSRRCLSYMGRNPLVKSSVCHICCKGQWAASEGVLHTVICLDPASKPELPLERGARIRLAEGFVEVRHRKRVDVPQLAVYERWSVLNRLIEISICAREGKRGSQHKELLTSSRGSDFTIAVCIVDFQC